MDEKEIAEKKVFVAKWYWSHKTQERTYKYSISEKKKTIEGKNKFFVMPIQSRCWCLDADAQISKWPLE